MLGAMKLHVAEFETVLRWDALGRRIRDPRRIFESPYLEPAAIIEGEAGSQVSECIACGQSREDVRDTPVQAWKRAPDGTLVDPQTVGMDVCRACRALCL